MTASGWPAATRVARHWPSSMKKMCSPGSPWLMMTSPAAYEASCSASATFERSDFSSDAAAWGSNESESEHEVMSPQKNSQTYK
jgi:hypothetical protein